LLQRNPLSDAANAEALASLLAKPAVPSATNLAKSKPEKEKKRKFSRNSGGLPLLSLIL